MTPQELHYLALIFGPVVLFIVVSLLEMAWPQRPARVATGLRWRASGVLYATNFALGIMIPVTALGTAYFAQQQGIGLLRLLGVGTVAGVILGVLALDLGQYLLHRALHRRPLLWRMHEVHHSDNDYDLTTGLRFHPLEALLTIGWRILIVLLAGPSVVAVMVYEVWVVANAFYTHANLRLPATLERGLRLALVTPTMHCIHHSTEDREVDSNFSSIFSFWDRLLGTYTAAPRRGYREIEFGLEWMAQPHRLRTLFAMPFRSSSVPGGHPGAVAGGSGGPEPG